VPCEFSRDELFSFVVIGDAQTAGELKQRNKDSNLTAAVLKNSYASSVDQWYYYSNQSPIIMLANNEWRDAHNVKENIVIISADDLKPSLFLRPFVGIVFDVDLAMVN